MIEISRLTLSLSDIAPSHQPYRRQWAGVQGYVYIGIHLDINLITIPVYGIIARNGNHRLGKIAQVHGLNTTLTAKHINDPDEEVETWCEMVEKARQSGIFTYNDFYHACLRDEFKE
ncbi:MAG: hypothetical protein AAB768_01760 [Patescibacteria group bacterium]